MNVLKRKPLLTISNESSATEPLHSARLNKLQGTQKNSCFSVYLLKLSFKTLSTLAVLALIAPIATTSLVNAQTNAKLLQIGNYHAEDVPDSNADGWYAVGETLKGWQVRPAKVLLKRIKDDMIDRGTEKTGWSVDVSGRDKPLFLVKDVIAVKPGAIKTVTKKKKLLAFNEDIQLRLGDRQYTVSTPATKHKNGLLSYSIVLSDSQSKQTLVSRQDCEFLEKSGPTLIWAGDLDGDGKLDLLLDTTANYNSSVPTLFLSTGAKPHMMVRLGPSFSKSGC